MGQRITDPLTKIVVAKGIPCVVAMDGGVHVWIMANPYLWQPLHVIMKKNLLFSLCILLLSGCKVHTFTVTDKKPPTRPFAKIMAIYLDEACDFTLFDSATYNICVKSCFSRTDNLQLRQKVESLLSDKISTGGTSVKMSADLLDSVTNSYADFRKTIEDRGFDAILLVIFRRSNHKVYFNGEASHQGRGEIYDKILPGFQCYLIPASNNTFQVWSAQLEIGDNTYNAQKGLTGKMAEEIARSLKTIGYIAH
jgi:hypothetical protein